MEEVEVGGIQMNLASSSLEGLLFFVGFNAYYFPCCTQQVFTSWLKLISNHLFPTLCFLSFQVNILFWNRSLEIKWFSRKILRVLLRISRGKSSSRSSPYLCDYGQVFKPFSVCLLIYKLGLLWRLKEISVLSMVFAIIVSALIVGAKYLLLLFLFFIFYF